MLRRRLTLLQAVSLNMAMMIGVGPFITIPDFVAQLGGPRAMIGWILAALVAIADGLVWSELAAAFPGSGGTYHFFDAIYGRAWIGRFLKFLFVWQFLFSGPLELGSGMIGLAQYAGYLWPWLNVPVWDVAVVGSATWRVSRGQLMALGLTLGLIGLAYRRIEVASRVVVALWVGVLATLIWIIVSGLTRFDAALVFDVPEGVWTLDRRFTVGLGTALGIAMYDFFGYYQICYLGDEVTDPPRTFPRAILISVAAVSVLYLTLNLSILGVLPWRQVITSRNVASDFMLARHGALAARLVTVMILWCAAAGSYAMLLGYSRVPYAAAKAGHFFRGLARTHPSGDFPHRSLVLVGVLSALTCLADLPTVIAALLTSRILIQFVAQIGTVFYVRRRPELAQRLMFRMALFPWPALVALAGWLYVFGTSSYKALAYGWASLGLGIAVFAVWDRLVPQSRLDCGSSRVEPPARATGAEPPGPLPV
jgi:amino acid transporter